MPPLPPQKIEVARGLGLAYAVTPSSEVSAPRFPVRKLYHMKNNYVEKQKKTPIPKGLP